MKTLIIRAAVLEPPTSLECFRQLTFWIAYDYRAKIEDILIESARSEIDLYYKFLKGYPGALDYITQFIEDDYKEPGIRLDEEFNLAPTIQTPYINENNVFNILRAVSYN